MTQLDDTRAAVDSEREHASGRRAGGMRVAVVGATGAVGRTVLSLLRELAAGGEVKGDVTTLEDLTVLAKLRQDED